MRVHGAIDMRRARVVVACLETVAAAERHATMAASVCVCRERNEETCLCSTVKVERTRLIDSTKPPCCSSQSRSRAVHFSSHGTHPVIDFPTLSVLPLRLATRTLVWSATPTDTGLTQGHFFYSISFFYFFHPSLTPLSTPHSSSPPPNKHTS